MGELGPDEFDFWNGTWECVLEGGHAVNTITREFGGHVTMERFAIDEPRTWNGSRVSAYDPIAQCWQRTWVDDDGNDWHFVGATVDGGPGFETPGPVESNHLCKRMVFTDITTDSFGWRWESSSDQHEWTQRWAISYERLA